MHNLKKNIFVNLLGTLCFLCINFLSVLVIARAFGANALGYFFLAQAIATPIASIIGLRYKEILATEPIESSIFNCLFNVSRLSLVTLIPVILFWLLAFTLEIATIGITIFLLNLADSFSQISAGRMTRKREFLRLNIFLVGRAIILLLCLFISQLLQLSFSAALALAIVFVYPLLALEIYNAIIISKHSTTKLTAKKIYSNILRPIPFSLIRLSIAESAGLLQLTYIRLLTGFIQGANALGIYGAITLVVRIFIPGSNAVLKTLLPEYAMLIKSNEFEKIKNSINWVALITISSSAAFFVLGFQYLPILLSRAYDITAISDLKVECAILFSTVPFIVSSRYYIHLLVAIRDTKSIDISAWLPGIIIIITAPILIYAYEILGASISFFILFLLRYSLSFFMAKRINASNTNSIV